jgi:hypothetical protein
LVTTIKKATKLIVAFRFSPKSTVKISFTGGANVIKKMVHKKLISHTILKQFIMKQQI